MARRRTHPGLATIVAALLIVFAPQPSYAQGGADGGGGPLEEITGAVSTIEGMVDTFCDLTDTSFLGSTVSEGMEAIGVGELEDMLFLCEYGGVLRRAERATSTLFYDVDARIRDTSAAVTSAMPRLTRWRAGTPRDEAAEDDASSEIEADLLTILEDIRAGAEVEPGVPLTTEAYREAAIAWAREEGDIAIANLDALAANATSLPEDSPERAFAMALRGNPIAAAIARNAVEATVDVATAAADSEANYQAGNLAAEAFLETNEHQETVVRTIAPLDSPTSPPGTAAQLEDRAGHATSTREAVNELARGWADYMRQDAVLSGTMIEGLRTMVRQGSVTNEALRQEAERRAEEHYNRIETMQHSIEAQLLGSAQDVETFFGGMDDLTNDFTMMFGETRYPAEYCELFGCPEGMGPAPAVAGAGE